MRERITKKLIDGLMSAPPAKDVDVMDTLLCGFGLRLKPSGSASYFVRYKTDGQERRLVLGKVGTLTPDEARRLARTHLAAVAGGADPSAERHQARGALTVAGLCDQYLEGAGAGLVLTRLKRPKRASTLAVDVGRIERHIKPLIGAVRCDRLSRAEVQRMADSIAEGKTAGRFPGAVVRGGPGAAARVVELLGGIWTWADRRGLVSGPSPVRGVEKVRGQAGDRVLSHDELRRLGQVLAEQAALQPAAVAAVRLLALTGLRRSEAVGLRWSEVDAVNSCLRLEASKTGRSTRPVGKTVLALLNGLPRTHGELVFPNRAGTGQAALKEPIAALFDAAGLHDARAHDLRRTYASTAAGLGYGDGVIGELLGHARRGVTAVHYVRRPDGAMLAASGMVASRIAAWLGGEAVAGEVVPLLRK